MHCATKCMCVYACTPSRHSPITPEMLSIPTKLLVAVYTEAEVLELSGMVQAMESAGAVVGGVSSNAGCFKLPTNLHG